MGDAAEVTTDNVEVEGEKRRVGFFGGETTVQAVFLVFGAIVIGLIIRKLQYASQAICCGDWDGYYHIKWSSLLWEGMRHGHFPPKFIWLPLTTLNPNDYVDHHLLFHFLQIPFTWSGDLRAGAKAAAWLFATLSLLSCYWLILRYRVRHALIWLIALLASSAPFLYRLNMAKAPPIAIIFTVIGIYLLFEKKYLLLLPVAFLFVWAYSLFIILTGMAIIWTLVIAWTERRFEWRPLVWTVAGTIAGLVINPYFPKDISLFVEHFLIKATLSGFTTEVGNEWYPYESWYLLLNCGVAFVAMVVGYVGFDWADRERSSRPLFLMLFSTVLMIASFRSRRWVEYWPPFAILFAAFALKPILEGVRTYLARLPSDVMEELKPFLDRHEVTTEVETKRRRDFWKEIELAAVGIAIGLAAYFVFKQVAYPPPDVSRLAALKALKVVIVVVATVSCLCAYILWRRSLMAAFTVVVVAMLVIVLNFNIHETHKEIAGDAEPDHYEASMAWIRENVPQGEMIFSTDWDDFPKMFYYDTRHTYVSGLDPTYLLDRDNQLKRDPSLAELYKNITTGKDITIENEKKDYGPVIREKFGARYVFSDNEHEDFIGRALDSGWFDEVHIYTFERKDGRALTQKDIDTIEKTAPAELNNWTLITGGRRLVSGATRDMMCTDVNGLCDQFAVNKDIDSTVLRIRDRKGQPPEESKDEGDESDEGDDGGDEQGNQ